MVFQNGFWNGFWKQSYRCSTRCLHVLRHDSSKNLLDPTSENESTRTLSNPNTKTSEGPAETYLPRIVFKAFRGRIEKQHGV